MLDSSLKVPGQLELTPGLVISAGAYTDKDAGENMEAFERLRTENLTLSRSPPAEA